MKTPISFLSSILLLTLFTKCASSQFDKKPPFTVTEAKHQEWTGDHPHSKGTIVTIALAEKVDTNIQFDSIYYNEKATAVKVEIIDNKTVLSGKFITTDVRDKLIIMDKDPKKEFGNKPPSVHKKLPFHLAENECVISYMINNKKHYHKFVFR